MASHTIISQASSFQPISEGIKTCDLRPSSPEIKAGDWLIIHEWDNGITGRQVTRKVTHVSPCLELDNFVLLSFN